MLLIQSHSLLIADVWLIHCVGAVVSSSQRSFISRAHQSCSPLLIQATTDLGTGIHVHKRTARDKLTHGEGHISHSLEWRV